MFDKKRFYKRLLRAKSRYLAAALALLGFATACEPSADEYGAPYAEYIFRGKVSNAYTQAPIPNIRISLNSDYFLLDSVRTDQDGNYEIVLNDYLPDMAIKVKAVDTDGQAYGSFGADSVSTTLSDKDLSGGDSWYKGSATYNFNFKLDEK